VITVLLAGVRVEQTCVRFRSVFCSLREELGYVFEYELVNELILHVSLYKSPTVVSDSSHSRKDRKLRLFDSSILLMPDLQDQLSKGNGCSCTSDASTAVNNSFFLIIFVCHQPGDVRVEHLSEIF
jgi:hypothetical protein